MAAFIKLEDSPMFENEISSLEQIADELKDRCQRLCKGSKRFAAVLGEACDADTNFADSLEAFGAGQDDPVSVSIGGPVISRFINAFREIATYKELLRSQVEHVLIDRLMHFVDVDLQDVKESRRRFDKAVHTYDQSREKFVSLKTNTRGEIVEELEEELQNSKSAFERSRFNLVSSLMNIEAKKKYEFLESISAVMDAHLKYFKLGYSLLSQMEPFIHQVLAYAQQSKELANIEQDKLAKRIQEFRTQAEMATIRGSIETESSLKTGGIHVVNRDSYKDIEAIMRSAENGEVQTIKQGYLLKRSSSLRGDWKRRFFVLDSQGTLYYYRNKSPKQHTGIQHRSSVSAEQNSGVFARFRSRHSRATSLGEASLAYHTIDLHTSTLKMDADDSGLRLCFRIISPVKTYMLQAENGADRMDWVNKITGVIASLFNSHFLQQRLSPMKQLRVSESNGDSVVKQLDSHQHLKDNMKVDGADSVSTILREIPGNEICAECSAPKPDWASLNLGILLCIECSGVHRNLGVHKSKVRSLTLDVKVWEPTVFELFRSLGNAYCNSLWEGLLLLQNERLEESNATILSIRKPCPGDVINLKEKYIQAKYVEKSLVVREATTSGVLSNSSNIWQAVKTNNLREVYHCIVISDANIVNTTFDEAMGTEFHQNISDTQYSESASYGAERKHNDPSSCIRVEDSNDPGSCLQGCSLLHLACHCGNLVMLELLLQSGADINFRDFHGRTPLHHCISKRDHQLAKFLLRRGASPSIRDSGGLSALERAMEMGAITDEELFILLSEC